MRARTHLPNISAGKRAWFILESSCPHPGTGARTGTLTSLGPGNRPPPRAWRPPCHHVPHPDVGSGAAGPTRPSLPPRSAVVCPSCCLFSLRSLRALRLGGPDPLSSPAPSELLPPTSGPLLMFLPLSRSLPFARLVCFSPSDLTRSLPVAAAVTGPCAVSRSRHFLPLFLSAKRS